MFAGWSLQVQGEEKDFLLGRLQILTKRVKDRYF